MALELGGDAALTTFFLTDIEVDGTKRADIAAAVSGLSSDNTSGRGLYRTLSTGSAFVVSGVTDFAFEIGNLRRHVTLGRVRRLVASDQVGQPCFQMDDMPCQFQASAVYCTPQSSELGFDRSLYFRGLPYAGFVNTLPRGAAKFLAQPTSLADLDLSY